jgi:hypothetical protein
VAARLTDARLRRLSIKPYRAIRPALRSGDLLFTAGDYLVSQVIRKFTGSPWSHVGILFRVDRYDERGFISPENIWRDRRVELVARIL